jgi:fatty acyl-CoA reductase
VVENLATMSVEEIQKRQQELIKPWANSYTYTKSLSERSLQKHRGNVPLLILRPAIIICSQAEPYPGWIDSLAAAGSLSILAGIGVMHYFYCETFTRADFVPVDMVSNAIIVGTAYQANRNSLTVMHSNSSHANPTTW